MRHTRSNIPVCLYCKKRGHIISECWELEKKKTRSNPVSIICTKQQSSAASKQVNTLVEAETENPFISEGYISLINGHGVPIRILRDTGATQSLLVEGILPLSEDTATGDQVLIQGVELGIVSVPLHSIHLESELVTGDVVVGLRPTLPMAGVSLILGNDLAGEKVMPELLVISDPMKAKEADSSIEINTQVFPSCAVTRAKARELKDREEMMVNLADTFMSHLPCKNIEGSSSHAVPSYSLENDSGMNERDKLIRDQMNDQELIRLAQEVVDEDEVEMNPNCYFKQSGVLMRKWRPKDVPASDTWKTVFQIVVPQ